MMIVYPGTGHPPLPAGDRSSWPHLQLPCDGLHSSPHSHIHKADLSPCVPGERSSWWVVVVVVAVVRAGQFSADQW